MIDGALTIADMRMLVALKAIYKAHGNAPLNYKQLKKELLDRGVPAGNGIGREVDDLEKKLGCSREKGRLILNRGKKGSTLTETGLTIATRCEAMIEQMEQLGEELAVGRRTLRFGVTNAITTNMLPSVFQDPAFYALVGNTDFEIVDGESYELVTTLLSHVEFAIGSRDVIPADCDAESLCRRKRVLLYNPQVKYKHDFSKPGTIFSLREWIRQETLLVPTTRVIPELETFLKPMTSGRKIILPIASLRRSWVERGVGVAISHEEKCPDLNNSDRIRTIDLSAELGESELMLFFRKKHELSPAAQCLVNLIRTLFGEQRGTGTT